MITIECPKCGSEFDDYGGENATQNDDGDIIDWNRYYDCPKCGTTIDWYLNEIVDYDTIRHQEPAKY